MERKQVIIVGGGPVGVALAVQLGMRGISCALVESRTELGRIPKGQNLTHRTLEHFYFMGIVDELRAARFLPPGFAIGEITSYGDLNGQYWFAPAGRELVHDYYFQKNDRLPQYQMEKVLRAKMATLPKVESRFGWTATKVEQDAGSARVTITKDGASEVLEGDYVVGCDGGHSIVREQIGIPRSGHDFDQLMVLIVLRSRELHDELGKRFPPKSIYRAMHPDLNGYWKFFGRIDVGEGFFFHAPVPKDTTRDNFDFHGPAARGDRLSVQGRVRPRRVLGPARRGRGEISGRARVHRRRRRAQPSALWRLRPQQRAGGRGQSRLEARGASSTAGAATRCCNPTATSGGRSSRRWRRISSPRASGTMARSSTATIRRATRRSSRRRGRGRRATSATARRSTSRATKARRW